MTAPDIQRRLLPYAQALEQRATGAIDLLVLHCTELPDLATARQYGERIFYPGTNTGNSGHYYIDRDGRVEQWVPNERCAHHVRGYNHRSIGIELVNLGRYPEWHHSARQAMSDPYPDSQIDSLLSLAHYLCTELPGLCWLAGHQDLDLSTVPASDDPALQVRRKLDPGPCFPWPRVQQYLGLQRFYPA